MTDKKLHIAVIIDARGEFGRGVFHGFTQYATTRENWRILLDDDRGRGTHWQEYNIDGMIAASADIALMEDALKQTQFVVNTSHGIPPEMCPSVLVDNRAVGEMAARHFLRRGFAHFAFYGATWQTFSNERREGFCGLLEEENIPCLVFSWVHDKQGNVDFPASHLHREDWLIELPKPVGIFTSHDNEAFSLLRLCQELGLAVPEEVAILGVDNDQLRGLAASPPLSSIQPNFQRQGYEAAHLLDDLLNGATPPEEPLLIPPVDVVTRQSTDIIAIDDPEIAQALRVIREHACDPISVEDVLMRVMISRRTLERRFREILGRTPHQEILRMRLARAEELLTRSDMKTAKIAEACGFRHIQNFNAYFRKAHGLTPGQFRKEHELPGSE